MNNKKIILSAILSCLALVAISCVITHNISYKQGYNTGYNKEYEDNQPRGSDSSPIVYVTKSGTKYHKEKCDYLANSSVEISREQAENKGYSPCSKCRPDRIK